MFELPEDRTLTMGILNVTPDSFSDGGQWTEIDEAVAHALQMFDDGADIIDVGGESTRPGAAPVDTVEELQRTVPVIKGIVAAAPGALISIDTTKSEVATAALDAGALIVNDISGLGFDARIADVVADHDAWLVLMHIQGTPRTMQQDPTYDDVVEDISAFLRERIDQAVAAGVRRERIIVDPGVGFGKTLEHNLEILRRLHEFKELGPVLLGASRKSFIGTITGRPVDERVFGTAATTALAVQSGASIVRVHDVAEMVDVVRMTEAILSSKPPV